jgi:hypothetical protein
VNLATDCPSCYGTGIVPSPYDPDSAFAHARQEVCGCGVLRERDPQHAEAIERYDGSRPFSKHKLVIVRHTGAVAWVDEALADDVHLLWNAGIGTVASCQGGYWPCDRSAPYIEIVDYSRTEEAAGLLPWVKAARMAPGMGVALYGSGCRSTGNAFLVCDKDRCSVEHPVLRRGMTDS